MAIQPARLLLASTPDWGAAGTATTINATGESSGVVGHVRIAGGGTKTISAAGGGRILWSAGAVTFATLGSAVRVGIQDVSAVTGLEDGSWDVYKEYVQGTDTISASTYNVATMSSGTKTLADGDLIAIVAEMTVLAGADSVSVGTTASGIVTNTGGIGFPYGTADTGSLAKNTQFYLYAVISFDDGTTGWILGAPLIRNALSTTNFNSGSVFDEYCSMFSVPFKIRISGVSVEALNIAAATDTFEVILYQDPLGTPIPLD
jgi:hypothetical protein